MFSGSCQSSMNSKLTMKAPIALSAMASEAMMQRRMKMMERRMDIMQQMMETISRPQAAPAKQGHGQHVL